MDINDKLFPQTTFFGEKEKGKTRQMASDIPDMSSFNTRKRLNPDGSETTLRTKGGMPRITKTEAKEAAEDMVTTEMFCRLIDVSHPWGISNSKTTNTTNADYAISTHPVSKGALPTTKFSCNADETKSDSPGPNRWMDTRDSADRQSSTVLSWASPNGSSLSVNRPYTMLYAAYQEAFGVGHPSQLVTQSNGGGYTAKAGEAFPGQILFDPTTYHNTAGRFTSPRFPPTRLYADGKETAIVGQILAAALCFSVGKHVRILQREYPTSGEVASNSMTLIYRTLENEPITSLPDKSVSFPSDVAGTLNINCGPAFNSSGTKAVVGLEVLLVGYPSLSPAPAAYRKHRVYEIDTETGVATEYAVGGEYGNANSFYGTFGVGGFPNHMDFVNYNAANFTKVCNTVDTYKTNTLLCVGYRGDDLRVARMQESISTTVYGERTNSATFIPGSSPLNWEEDSVTNTRNQQTISTVSLVIEPIGEVFSTSGGTSSSESATSTASTYSESRVFGWTGNAAGVPATVLIDFLSDTYVFVSTKAYSGSVGYSSSTTVTTPQSGGSNGWFDRTVSSHQSFYRSDVILSVANGDNLASPQALLIKEKAYNDVETVSGSTETLALPYLTYQGATAATPPSGSSGGYMPGLSDSRKRNRIIGVDGVSMATTENGKTVVVSALLGNGYSELIGVNPSYSMLSSHNVLCKKTSAGWRAKVFSLPAYIGDLGWMMEPVIMEKYKG